MYVLNYTRVNLCVWGEGLNPGFNTCLGYIHKAVRWGKYYVLKVKNIYIYYKIAVKKIEVLNLLHILQLIPCI